MSKVITKEKWLEILERPRIKRVLTFSEFHKVNGTWLLTCESGVEAQDLVKIWNYTPHMVMIEKAYKKTELYYIERREVTKINEPFINLFDTVSNYYALNEILGHFSDIVIRDNKFTKMSEIVHDVVNGYKVKYINEEYREVELSTKGVIHGKRNVLPDIQKLYKNSNIVVSTSDFSLGKYDEEDIVTWFNIGVKDTSKVLHIDALKNGFLEENGKITKFFKKDNISMVFDVIKPNVYEILQLVRPLVPLANIIKSIKDNERAVARAMDGRIVLTISSDRIQMVDLGDGVSKYEND